VPGVGVVWSTHAPVAERWIECPAVTSGAFAIAGIVPLACRRTPARVVAEGPGATGTVASARLSTGP